MFLFNTTIRENITLGEHFTDEQMEKALRDSALAGDLANMPKEMCIRDRCNTLDFANKVVCHETPARLLWKIGRASCRDRV